MSEDSNDDTGKKVIFIKSLEERVCFLRFCQGLTILEISKTTRLKSKTIKKLIENVNQKLAKEAPSNS